MGHIVFYVYKTLSTSVKSGVHLHEIFTHAMAFTEALNHIVFHFLYHYNNKYYDYGY